MPSRHKGRNLGITLLEALLVLTIAACLMYLGLRQYMSFRLYGDVSIVQSNVDTIFLGLGQFYRANCYGTTNQPGQLRAANGQTTPFPISLTTDLSSAGFMSDQIRPSQLVNATTTPASGYIAQFNPSPEQIRYGCLQENTATNPPTCTTPVQIGTIVGWTAQVAVLMTNTTDAPAYAQLLGADCASSLGTGGSGGAFVNPCSVNKTGPYVVWEREPSYTSSQSNSTYWESIPVLKQFTQMYTTEPLSVTTSTSHTPEYQYYYCGN